MKEVRSKALDGLIARLDRTVCLGDVRTTTQEIKAELSRFSVNGTNELPERFRHPKPDSYARRLLHRDPELGYTVVVMTWGPGQATPLHDHAGIWCVECVLAGELDVTQYDLLERKQGRCLFVRKSGIRARVGNAGSLIPPFEYHTLQNALSNRTSVSMHVYGGEMDRCNLYHERSGWWQRTSKSLRYDN